MDVAWEVAELKRRLANVVRVGVVAEADYGRAAVRARYADDPVALTDWIPFAAQRAGGDRSWFPPDVGEQVILVSPGGDLAQAICALSLYSDASPPPLEVEPRREMRYANGASTGYRADRFDRIRHIAADGAVLAYDGRRHRLRAHLPGGGNVEIRADEGTTIVGDVEIEGDVSVTGSISATADVSDGGGSMAEMRQKYNSHTHGSTPTPQPRMD